ncbi:hypothetical protein E2320_000009 [Naja naja]|nr:hypothetical protein E2320_000009 [Naja naja]
MGRAVVQPLEEVGCSCSLLPGSEGRAVCQWFQGQGDPAEEKKPRRAADPPSPGGFQIPPTREPEASATRRSRAWPRLRTPLRTPALGRPFQLGMLYDCRKDNLIPGVTLWNYKSLQEDLTIKAQPKTESEIIASDSLDDKASALDISASLKSLFDREVSSMEMVKNIEGSLYATLTKEISIGGEAKVKLTEEEKENALKFRCKFHGDFSLENNPVTFQDAMKVYETLPKLLGEHGEKAVPVRVWLYPLTKLDTRAAKMVRKISLTLIFDAKKILEELNEIQMQSNNLAKNPIAETFPEIKRKIQEFNNLCQQHRQTFQKELARVLPSIRGGGQEEGTLVDILMSVNQSPFNRQRLHEFLDTKKREMNFVKSYLTILSEIQVISSQNKLEEIVLDPQNGYVVSFIFTSLHEEEPFLLSLQDWLQEQFLPESVKSARSSLGVKKSMAWFEDKEWTYMENPGASIYLYEDGDLVSMNFELPSKPLPFLISEVRHDSIQLKFQPAEYGRAAISNYLVEYKMEGEENWKTVRTEDAGTMFLLKDLPPNTEYQFQYIACCKVGLNKFSDLSPPIKTLPTSPPEKLKMVTAASCVISMAWMSPSIVASGVVVKEYKMEYRSVEAGIGKDQWSEKRTGKKTEFYPIEGLKPQTAYRIRVLAVCDNGALGVPSEELEVSTSLEKEDADNVAHQCFHQLGKKNLEVPNKVILVMGGTGCGKTTLINGMIHYILGVQWEDNFRFKLIHEATQRSEAGSRTSEVTAYMVNHQKGFRIPYSLTIIDTPGFGGTRDTEQDNLVEEKLLEFFSTPGGIDHVDAICLVAQAFFSHSTHAQKHVFDSIFSILGKDVKDNNQLLITFADGGTPLVLEALKEADMPCAQDEMGSPLHFRFNHSALFAPQEYRGNCNAVSEMSWKMSTETMKDFFDSLKILETKSLNLTMEVLKKHQELETALRRPLPPKVEQVHPNSLQISIDPVAIGKPPVSRYQVEYRIAGDNWKSLNTEGLKDQFTLKDVHLNRQYQFRCAAVTPRNSLNPCLSGCKEGLQSESAMTNKAVVDELERQVYELRVPYWRMEGAITCMLSKTGSRRSEVTAYVVNHQKGFRIPYSLTIIDTPGFGGTRDAEQDKLVQEQLLEFFSTPGGFDHMDVICLVPQAFLSHSTHAQKCVFDSMLSVLGKDLKDNIQLLITFADGGTPPVLETLKEADLPCAQDESPQHFRFNHSALFAPQEYGGSHNIASEMFWKMNTVSMKDFFDSIKMVETKSLTLTMEVLKKHQELETALRRPPAPKVEQVHPNRFQISIDLAVIAKPSVSRYQVEYQIAGDNWKSLSTECPKDQFTLEDVHLNLRYQFQCAAVTPVGLGQWSEVITCICPTGMPAETDIIQQIEEIFGLQAKDYMIILFIHKDDMKGESLEKLISFRDKKVKEYIAECGNRCLIFNNMAEGAE